MTRVFSISHSRMLQRAGVFGGSAAILCLAAPAAHGEVVSKLPGADGLPFPAQFVDASSDGRYVLLAVGTFFQAPPATGPEADIAPLGRYVLRDRVADTTTPLRFRASPGGALLNATPTQISDDGDRIMITAGNDAEVEALGASVVVYDRSDDRVLQLPSLPASVRPLNAKLSADGTRALVAAVVSAQPYRTTWWRGPLGATANSVLDLPDAVLTGNSGDLNILAYTRVLPSANRPTYERDRPNRSSSVVVGVKAGEQPPRILDEGEFVETPPAPGGACTNASVGFRSTEFGTAVVSADGARVGWPKRTFTKASSVSEPSIDRSLESRWADGRRTSTPYAGPYYYPFVTAFGSANELLYDAGFSQSYTSRFEFVGGDTELVGSVEAGEYGDAGGKTTRYTEATPFEGVAAPAPVPFALSDEPVDTADRVSTPEWFTCPAAAADAPIGAFGTYASIKVASKLTASNSIGMVDLDLTPSSQLRAAASATVEVTLFGYPIWRKTFSQSTDLTLPKPLYGLPTTLKVSVQPATTPGQPRPATLVSSRSIWTLSYR